jgi:hypothetical protein
MSILATVLFPLGAVAIAIGFAAHVGHAVLLANGRRSLTFALQGAQPAWAGAVTGSFATARLAQASQAPGDAPLGIAPTPLGRAAAAITAVGFGCLLAYLIVRGITVGRGPWGNMFEFSVAFATSVTGGYLFLSRRYPIRAIGFIPTGVSLALLLYASSLPSSISQLVPALQNPPLITIHVGLAVLSYGIFATSFAAGVGYLIQGQKDRFAWLPNHKVLDEVA